MFEGRLRWREMLPIVTRELRVAATRRVSYRLRVAVACLGAAVVIIIGLIPGTPAETGRTMFWMMSLMMLLICGVAGLLLTADSVSREKREGTLGLLFTTRLGGADIVLGKLAAGSLNAGSAAFAALPFLAFTLCLGGVTGRDFWVMSFFLLFLIAYSLCLGIFVSTLFRRESVVSLVFCLLMWLPVAATPLAAMAWKSIPPWLSAINPFYPAMAMMDSRGVLCPDEQVRPALISQGLAMIFMVAAAALIVPWTVRSRPFRPQFLERMEPPAIRRFRGASRAMVLDANPVLWLSQRQNHPLALLWLCAGFWLVVGFSNAPAADKEMAYVVILAVLPKLFVLWHSSGMMAAERQSGFLEALLTTPLTAGEVLQGKIRAIKRHIAPAVLFAMLVQWAAATAWWAADGEIGAPSTLLLASMATILVDVHTIAWIGLWQGLTARDRRRALIRSILWGLVAPWLPAFIVLGSIFLVFEPRWLSDPVNTLSPALISSNVASFAIACLAMARLHEKFRSTATQTWSFKTAH